MLSCATRCISAGGLPWLGLLLVYPTWVVLLFLVFSVVAFIGRARREDAALAERFGEAWTEYKKRTKFLIPFIY